MIIYYLDIDRTIVPFKDNSPLFIDADAVKTSQITFQDFEAVTWWRT